MPESTEELRTKIRERFDGSIDSEGPTKYLENAGYVLTPQWVWIAKPGVTSYEEMTPEELECLDFLIQEWDYGGLEHLPERD